MGGPVTRVDGALRRAVADAAEGSAGQQRLGLMLYLAVAPASMTLPAEPRFVGLRSA